MRLLIQLLRRPVVRVAFLALATGAAIYAVVRERAQVGAALHQVSPVVLVAALGASLLYVVLTMLSWRAVMVDLGSRRDLRPLSKVFFVSQIGKYVPGGVWNVVAAAELGADHLIPRRRSLSGMAVMILVSLTTGLSLAALMVAFAPPGSTERYRVVAVAAPLMLVLLAPRVLNRLLDLALRLTGRPPLEHPMTATGIALSSGWAVLAWLVAGTQVWMLAGAVGMPKSASTWGLAVGGYALAWVVGFLVILVPAGLGAREVVLLAVLAGALSSGGVLVTVLLSRVLLTVADLLLAGAAYLANKGPSRSPQVRDASPASLDE